MSFTYTAPTTDRDKVRFYIGDTTENAGVKPDGSNFSNEELDAILSLTGSWVTAVPVALRTLANIFASALRSSSIEGYSENFGDAPGALRVQATEWELKYPDEAAFDAQTSSAIGSLIDDTTVPAFFGNDQYGFEVTDRRQVKG